MVLIPRWVTVCGCVVCAVLLAIAVTGCSGATAGSPKLLDETGYKQARTTIQGEYALPASFRWTDPPAQEQGTKYEEGVARAEVESYWVVAWETEWLEQRGKDPARAAKALDILRNKVPKSRLMTEYSDESVRRIYTDALAKAELGDPSGIQRDIELNGLTLQRTP
ncbi:MAG: hypothetical protein Q7W30_06515 [Coriobacteriia bacterium]|nr:hypothetical protein [Coriobacteriia bacterium]